MASTVLVTTPAVFGAHIPDSEPPTLATLNRTEAKSGQAPVDIVMDTYQKNIALATSALKAMISRSGECREHAQRCVTLFTINSREGDRGLSEADEAKAVSEIDKFRSMTDCLPKLRAWHATAVIVQEYVKGSILPEAAAISSGSVPARERALGHLEVITALERSMRASLMQVDDRLSTWSKHVDTLQGKLNSLAVPATNPSTYPRSWMSFGWGDGGASGAEPSAASEGTGVAPLPPSPVSAGASKAARN